MRNQAKIGMMTAMVGMMSGFGNNPMYDEPMLPKRKLPNVPKSSTKPDYDGFDKALGEHVERFKNKSIYEINGVYLPGLSLKHVGKVLRKLMAEYNIPQFKTQEELASQIKYTTGIDIEDTINIEEDGQ